MSLNSSVLTSIAEAAGRLDVSIKLVRRYIAAGDLVATRVKGIWRIDVESIESLKIKPKYNNVKLLIYSIVFPILFLGKLFVSCNGFGPP
jgi:predicted site-specific integrase-resolvase